MNSNTNTSIEKLNILPLFGDFTLLIIGIFIIIMVGTLVELAKSENPETIPTGTYFSSREFKLDPNQHYLLDQYIRNDGIFSKIKKSLIEKKLSSLRIEGHSDSNPPPLPVPGQKWEDNMELSFFRAKEVSKIIMSIADDSLSSGDRNHLKNIMLIAGYGENKPDKSFRKNMDGNYYLYDIKTGKKLPRIYSDFDSIKNRKDELNRRVVINIIEKGI